MSNLVPRTGAAVPENGQPADGDVRPAAAEPAPATAGQDGNGQRADDAGAMPPTWSAVDYEAGKAPLGAPRSVSEPAAAVEDKAVEDKAVEDKASEGKASEMAEIAEHSADKAAEDEPTEGAEGKPADEVEDKAAEDLDEAEADPETKADDGEERDADRQDKVAATQDPDPFAAFAPVVSTPPGRARSVADRVMVSIGRFFGHEWTLAAIGSLVLAAVMTWPTLRDPTTTIPQDIWDPTLQAWQMSWAGHALTTDPLNLWNANAFYPEKYSYAFSDTLLGYGPAGMIGDGPVAAIVRYNVIYVLIFALAFFGAYVLARQLGTGRTGAAVAGAAFAYAPWRLGQAGHLHVLSIGGIALALAMLARGHGFSLRDGYQPERRRWGWVLGGWLVAAWQISLGFGIGIPFAYVLLGLVVGTAAVWWHRRRRVWVVKRPFGWKLLLANLGGGVVFAGVGALMAYPYLQVLQQHPYARRSERVLALFSPPLEGFFIAPPESWLWGESYADARASLPWAPEMAMLPGFFLYGLAFTGLFFSVWSRRHRLLLGIGVVVSILLAMGTKGPLDGQVGYLLLYRLLPGFDGIRTPGRLVLWTTLLLALLAAGAVTALVHRAIELRAERGDTAGIPRAGFWGRMATLVPLALVLVEGAHMTPHPVVPPSPIAMRTMQGPMIVLPSDELGDMNVMLWSTDGFPRMANGGSGFTPHSTEDVRAAMESFPDDASVAALRDLGIRTVVVVRSRAIGTRYERAVDAPIDGLGLTRTESGDAVIYRVE